MSIFDDFQVRGGRLWMYLFLAHAMVASGWWWLMPGGFPWGHSRFWLNQILPVIVAFVSTAGCYGIWSRRESIVQSAVYALLGFWTGAVAMAWLVFPISFRWFGIPAGMILATVWLSWFVRSPQSSHLRRAVVVFIPAFLFGAVVPWLLSAPDPTVMPRNEPIPVLVRDEAVHAGSERQMLPLALRTNSAMAMIQVSVEPLLMDVSPLLTFESCSPDRCWTIFAPTVHHTRPRQVLRDEQHTEGRSTYFYEGGGEHRLQVAADASGTVCAIESFSQLERPIFSHLNFYTDLSISGHRKLSIAFSPCPNIQIDVEPADYPVGRPARFAYLDAAQMFHVVEALSGEKGPFKDLASGPLSFADTLTMRIFDEGRPIVTIALEDWASQSSTALSPTAGWGVPQNAIEFRRASDAPESLVSIWVTLASTSVGRGWDSVGHSAGIYRNRICIAKQPE